MIRTNFSLAMSYSLAAGLLGSAAGCGSDPPELSQDPQAITRSAIQHVFVIMLENRNASEIYSSSNAPYLNQLMKGYAHAANFTDVLTSLPSEPHYVWLEAGTNSFSDRTFTSDSDPSSSNSTASTAHLSTLLTKKGLTWTAYQEDINSSTGTCPVKSSGLYAAKHNPFVFFQDVAGSPPSKTNAACAAHTKPMTALAADLTSGSVGHYNLITPNLCHDMHGSFSCLFGLVKDGDTWLKNNLPPIIAYANANQGVIFITWDEAEGDPTQPFVVVGPHVKSNYSGMVHYDMSSVLKSMQKIFEVTPLLGHAADPSVNELSDLFVSGFYP
jgi:hypothetical protein